MNSSEDFDVLLSFAGPDRHYARAIYEITIANGLKVFLDEEFQAEIWGKNLVEYLHETYSKRGRFVVALLSQDYCNRAYTRVERRAALDRLIQQDTEYLLPVRIDDSWIPGLPAATASIDIRRIGVLGVCEALVQKVLGVKVKLIIPDGLRVPRVPRGSMPSEHIAEHLLELCRNQSVAIFGALIYDETTISLRKLLGNQIDWEAIDVASGPDFEIFAIRDQRLHGTDPNTNIGLITAFSMSKPRDRGFYYSRLLKQYFGEEKTTLVYPSVLIFIVSDSQVRKCWLVPGPRANTEDTLNWLIGLCTCVRDAIATAGGSAEPVELVLKQLRLNLLAGKYTLYIQSAPNSAELAIEGIADFLG